MAQYVVPPESEDDLLRHVTKVATWVPLSLEMRADMGLPLTDEERETLAERDREWQAYRRTWRYRWRRLTLRLEHARAGIADRIGGGSYYRYGCDHDD